MYSCYLNLGHARRQAHACLRAGIQLDQCKGVDASRHSRTGRRLLADIEGDLQLLGGSLSDLASGLDTLQDGDDDNDAGEWQQKETGVEGAADDDSGDVAGGNESVQVMEGMTAEIKALQQQLAAVTAERDAVRPTPPLPAQPLL